MCRFYFCWSKHHPSKFMEQMAKLHPHTTLKNSIIDFDRQERKVLHDVSLRILWSTSGQFRSVKNSNICAFFVGMGQQALKLTSQKIVHIFHGFHIFWAELIFLISRPLNEISGQKSVVAGFKNRMTSMFNSKNCN